MEVNHRAPFFQRIHDLERWALACIIYILLIGDADHENAGVSEGKPGPFIKRLGDLLHDPLRHRPIDLAGKLDKSGVNVDFACLPGQVEWVDWITVSA